MSCHVMLCYVMLCCVMLCCVVLYCTFIILYCVFVLCCVMSVFVAESIRNVKLLILVFNNLLCGISILKEPLNEFYFYAFFKIQIRL